ncbi:uncharacterized protein LOC108485187 [Gossypium arboreum]|uniref:uncharacterized protein LOC108485187 n=1 Tax=Gossypium arboreum TaxID=29729 RepID=UPI000818F73F|nr:uncharacterized protein LOC108485187 [Gossypium arboreum]
MDARIALSNYGAVVAELRARPIFLQEICEAQSNDNEWKAKRTQRKLGSESDFRIGFEFDFRVLRFSRKGKLSHRFIGPYEIIERIGLVAYRLTLLSELEKIHDVFHVSMLRRYRSDPSHVISQTEVEIQPDMTYGEEPIKILDWEIKQLKNKNITLVKVLWHRYGIKEATWGPEEAMRNQYTHLLTSNIFENENP